MRGDYRTAGGRISLLVKMFSWPCWCWCTGAACSPGRISRNRCVRHSARDYRDVGSAGRPRGCSPRRRSAPLRRENRAPHPHAANLADIWRRADLPRDGKAPVLLQAPGGADDRDAQATGISADEPARRKGLDLVCRSATASVRSTRGRITSSTSSRPWHGVKANIAEYGGDPTPCASSADRQADTCPGY